MVRRKSNFYLWSRRCSRTYHSTRRWSRAVGSSWARCRRWCVRFASFNCILNNPPYELTVNSHMRESTNQKSTHPRQKATSPRDGRGKLTTHKSVFLVSQLNGGWGLPSGFPSVFRVFAGDRK